MGWKNTGGNINKSDELLEQALNIKPENAEIYVVKLLIEAYYNVLVNGAAAQGFL